MNADPDLRASDTDREQVAAQLRDHAAVGRLTPEELEERIDVAYKARTLADLAELTRDLPPPLPVRAPQRELARRRLAHHAGASAITVVACVAIWAAAGAHGSFWPVWVIVAAAIILARDGWRTLGPGGGLTDEQLASRRRRRQRDPSTRRLPPD